MSQCTDLNRKGPSAKGRPDPDAHAASFAVCRSLKRELLAELCASRQQGTSVRPEDLLPRWPTNPEEDPDVASLLFEDFRQRSQHGEKPSREEYEQRFPEHKDSLAHLFGQRDLLRSLNAASENS